MSRMVAAQTLGLAWLMGVLVLLPHRCRAESAVSGQLLPQMTGAPSYGAEVLKIFLYLGCLIGGLFILRVLLRRSWVTKNRQPHDKPIRVVAQHYFEPRKSLIIVEVAGRRLLLASAAERLEMLVELPQDALMNVAGGSLAGPEKTLLPRKQVHHVTPV